MKIRFLTNPLKSLSQKLFNKSFLTIIFLILTNLFNNSAQAEYYNGFRQNSSWIGTEPYGGRCDTGNIDFNFFSGNKDLLWEIDNPTCISYVSASGIALKAAGTASALICQNYGAEAALAQSIAAGVGISPAMAIQNAKEMGQCAKMTFTCLSTLGTGVSECALAASCCAAATTSLVTFGASVGALGIIYDRAKTTFEKARICGHDWNNWTNEEKTDLNGNKINVPQYGSYEGSYSNCLDNIFQNNSNKCSLSPSGTKNLSDRDIKNKYFREYIYAGKEYEYNGSFNCKNPRDWDSSRRLKILGYDSESQRYYMKGPNAASNYACSRFLLVKGSKSEVDSGKDAFECCQRASQESLCLENNDGIGSDYKSQFCSFGSRCESKGIWFSIYQSKAKSSFICAKTYSVCPYNHLLGGGNEQDCSTSESGCIRNNGSTQNYNDCQYMKHCVKVPDKPYIKVSNLGDSYISSACRDFKGDSQNSYSYDAGILPISSKHFSAPIAQCFKETLENMFLNKTGYTKCSNGEEPKDGNCENGYEFKKGDRIDGPSFFQKIQNSLRTAIKLALTIAITVIGIRILLGGKVLERKEILMFIVKLGLVFYFAVGTAWQDSFFDGIYSSSAYFSEIFMKIDEKKEASKLDGCQFPRYNYLNQNDTQNKSYPPGKEYLKIWDTLDCKIAMSLGFGPEASVPNLFLMILGGFLTGGLGIIFFLATLIFAFFLLALAVRTLHIFLMSLISIILLIYISPIMICTSLFKKTEKIFKNWWSNLLGFILQPVILFAYMGIMLTIFDSIIIGDAKFKKVDNNPPQIECDENANNTSIYCIFRIAEIKKFTGFEPIGIGLPMLFNINQTKLATIAKAAFIVFILTSVLDRITQLAAKMVGGTIMSSQSKGVGEMLGRTYGGVRAIQSRAIGGVPKLLKFAASMAKNKVSSVSRAMGIKTNTKTNNIDNKIEPPKQEASAGDDISNQN